MVAHLSTLPFSIQQRFNESSGEIRRALAELHQALETDAANAEAVEELCEALQQAIHTAEVPHDIRDEITQAIAEHLVGHPALDAVDYPGLPTHPGHELAKRKMRSFGGMISLALKAGPKAARKFAESTKVFQLAESLGGVESLIEVPQAMTHQSVEGSDAAVPADLVRLSCGIEAASHLVADRAAALK